MGGSASVAAKLNIKQKMNSFQKRTAIRIALVTTLMAALASPLAWYVARKRAEETIVALAIEETGRLLHFHDAIDLNGPDATTHARQAAAAIVGGMFDIAEIYNSSGLKLAEKTTPGGREVETLLPGHNAPRYAKAWFEGQKLANDLWVLRVFVPLRQSETDMNLPVTGYFEGVRIVPDWQQQQLFASAFSTAMMVCLASLLCGAVIYPIVIRLSADNTRKTREVLDSHLSMMEALGRAIAKRDSDTGAHNYRVAWIAARIAEKLGMGGRAMQSLIAGSFLHDVGKIGIPDAILLKPGRLDEEEFAVMRTHVSLGEEIVSGLGWLEGARAIVAAHHEKWDGSGYPRRIAGEEIPLAARIFAVADVFDALCSKRPYKEALDFASVMAILEQDTDQHFDQRVMEVFRPLARDIFERLQQQDEEDARILLEERVRVHFGL
jgi:HD-GYP domain-containing protein (c-di-GMP phosphodiesterase class II)